MAALRVPFAIGSGGLLSLGLFWMLWVFVGAEMDVRPPVDAKIFKFTRQIVDTTPDTNRRERIERDPPTQVIDIPRITDGGGEIESTRVAPLRVDTRIITDRAFGRGLDRDPLPLVRIEPDYPPRAVTTNTEGWVLVQFSVNEIGAVENAFVVDADPKNMFDAAALKAVARWRYQPKIQDGVAVERVGLQTVFRFTLEE